MATGWGSWSYIYFHDVWHAWGGGGKGALVLMQLRGKGHPGSFGGMDGLSHWGVGILAVKNEVLGEWVTLKIIEGHPNFL